MLKLEPDLPAGKGPAEGSFGESPDVSPGGLAGSPCHTNSQAVCGQGGCSAQHAPPLPDPAGQVQGDGEKGELQQTMSYPLHCTIEGQGGTLAHYKVTVFIF